MCKGLWQCGPPIVCDFEHEIFFRAVKSFNLGIPIEKACYDFTSLCSSWTKCPHPFLYVRPRRLFKSFPMRIVREKHTSTFTIMLFYFSAPVSYSDPDLSSFTLFLCSCLYATGERFFEYLKHLWWATIFLCNVVFCLTLDSSVAMAS